MSIWTRISDAALLVGGSLVSVLSRVSGGSSDTAEPERSVAFTIGVIALGAKMAKVDGWVSGAEVTAFKEVFQVAPEELANVARVFNLAKQDVAGFEAYARQLARLFADRPEVLEDVVDSLFHIAKSDGAIDEAEVKFLSEVADIFGLTPRFRCIMARHVYAAANEPYAILGIDPCVSDEEARRHYRRLVRENHPDRHIAAGMPAEMVAIANERLAAITTAWSEIARERRL
jgi:DnaJ like chaperone protein